MDTINHAIYPGSFDPITNGHLDVIERGLNIFDSITILLAKNIQKKSLFTTEERFDMITHATNDKRIKVDILENGLVANYAIENKAKAIIRGLRQVSDFEYEYQIALMNRHLHPEVTTVFVMPNEKYTYLTSSIIREIASFGGNIRGFVPSYVEEKLQKKFGSSKK